MGELRDKNNMSKSNKLSGVLFFIVIVLLVIVVIEFSVIVRMKNASNDPIDATATPANTASQTASPESKETPTQAPTDVPTNTPTATPTSTPTPTPTPTPGPTYEPTEHGIDEVAARIIESDRIDYSFLDGISTAHFEDCGEDESNYDWYPGDVKKTADGKITYPWDRYNSVLAYLKKYGGIYRKNTNLKDPYVCYFTFDCGYENGETAKILDVLKEKNVQAIFFVTGAYVDDPGNLKLLKRMVDEGHLIGSHTDNHKVMPTLSNEEFVDELNSLYKKLKNKLGESFTMLYYRPPQGASCPRDLALAEYLGYHTVFWSFAYNDYDPDKQPDTKYALDKMESWLHPGCVFLLHAVSSTNAEVLGDFIDYIRNSNYEIRRIDQ